jgi:hypothetical protein
MTIFCEYANPNDTALVNYHPDTDSVTVIPATDQRVVDFVDGGGVIGPYVTPPPPPPVEQIDQATLNAALSAPGSVVRALALVMLQEINTLRTRAGLAAYTQAQLVTALQAKMRP